MIGFVIFYLIITLADEYKQIKIWNKNLPDWITLILSLITILLLLIIIISIINNNIHNVIELKDEYQIKFQQIITKIGIYFELENPPKIKELIFSAFKSIDKANILNQLTSFAKLTGLSFIYVIFFLLEYRIFNTKLTLLFPQKEQYQKVNHILSQINYDIKKYIKIKTIISLITALLSYIVLKSIGVHFAEFWALLIFIFNYIPAIGTVLAVTFPISLTLVQFDSISYFLLVAPLLIVIQIVMGNILDPRFIGDSLNISPLIIINVVLAKFPSTRPIAILLSARGKIENKL